MRYKKKVNGMGVAVAIEKSVIIDFTKKTNMEKRLSNPIDKYLDALKSLSPEEMQILSDMVEDKD